MRLLPYITLPCGPSVHDFFFLSCHENIRLKRGNFESIWYKTRSSDNGLVLLIKLMQKVLMSMLAIMLKQNLTTLRTSGTITSVRRHKAVNLEAVT
jgi:hypothetical protein